MSPHRPQRTRHRGSIYLFVLVSSLLVTVLGLGSLMAVRLQMRSARLSRDCAAARACATSAVEIGMLCIEQDPSWRSTRPNGIWIQEERLGDGRFTVEGTDPGDGVLSDSPYEPLVLTGTGTRGPARHKAQVTLMPVTKPLEVLNTCLHGSGQVAINNTRRISLVGAPFSTNGQLVNNGTLDGDAHVNTATPVGTITGALTMPAPVKTMPATSVIAEYAAKATSIPYTGTIDKAVLTPGCNPWGPTDPNGLYILDTGGNSLSIKNTRIHGTLIIRAPNKTVTLENAMYCQNYRSQMPVLLVEGSLCIKCTSVDTQLSESSNAVNYNPTGAPYEGVSDSDNTDAYPNEIRGLVYVKGSIILQETAGIIGTVVCEGTITCDGNNTIVYSPGLHACPPDGFKFVDGMTIVPGSWGQVVD